MIRTYRLLSLNVDMRMSGLWQLRSRYLGMRLEELLRVTAEYDVVCLQEFFKGGENTGCVQGFLKRLRQQGFMYMISGPNKAVCGRWPGSGGGLLVASKHPIVEYEKVIFQTARRGIDRFVRRGFLSCRIAIDGHHHVQVLNTQLQTPPCKPSSRSAQQHRRIVLAQATQVAGYIRVHLDASQPILLCGGFGTDALCGDYNVIGMHCRAVNRVNSYFSRDTQVYRGVVLHQNMPSVGPRSNKEYIQLIRTLNVYNQHASHSRQASSARHTSDDGRADDRTDMQIRDLLLDQYNGQPVTYGDIVMYEDRIEGRDKVLTPHTQQGTCQRLDYAFTYDNQAFYNIEAVVRTLQLVNSIFQQVSSHYAVEVRMTFPDYKQDQ